MIRLKKDLEWVLNLQSIPSYLPVECKYALRHGSNLYPIHVAARHIQEGEKV